MVDNTPKIGMPNLEHMQRALIIDDEEGDQVLLRRSLDGHYKPNLNIATADCVEAAFQVLKNFTPDIILLDYNLPDGNAVDFLKRAQLSSVKLPPVLVITGKMPPDGLSEPLEYGAIDFILKDTLNSESLPFVLSLTAEKLVLMEKLAATQAILEDRNAELKLFAERVSHDLKSLLNTFNSVAMLMDEKDLDAKSRAECAAVMNSAVHRGAAVIDGISQLSEVEPIEQFMPAEISEMVQRALEAFREPVSQGNMEVHVECPHSIHCGVKILPQLFQNLITNSVQFTQGIRKPVIHIKTEALDANNVRVTYTDNGPGISPAQCAKLTEALDGFGVGLNRSLGLGLSIVKRIVGLHKGSISVGESRQPHGASFTIVLPKMPPNTSHAGVPYLQ